MQKQFERSPPVQKFVGLLVVLCLGLTSCAAIIIRGPADDGAFIDGVEDATRLGPQSVVAVTTNAVYVSSDSGQTWTGVYSLSEQRVNVSLRARASGSPAAVFFVVSRNDDGSHSIIETLMKWTPNGGVGAVCQLPPMAVCRFGTDRVGGYVHGRHVFFTSDGGMTWKEAQGVPRVDPPQSKGPEFEHGRPTEEGLFTLAWESSSRALVVAGGAVAAYDVAADGRATRRWIRNVTHDGSIHHLLAVGRGEVWLDAILYVDNKPTSPQVCMFKISDGSPITRRLQLSTNAAFLIAGDNVYVGDDEPEQHTLARYQLEDDTARPVGEIPFPSFVQSLAPLDPAGVLILGGDLGDEQYSWDGRAAHATQMHPQIDNAIVRKYYLGPDQVSNELMAEFGVWIQKAGMQASAQICEAANEQTGWSHAQTAKWVIEQCKAAAANHGVWTRPTTMPAAEPAAQ
jgi:hypothetical protein